MVALVVASTQPALAGTGWKTRIDDLIGARQVSVAITDDGAYMYGHLAGRSRIPASNEKLLLSMALLDSLPATETLATVASVRDQLPLPPTGAVQGNLWLSSQGDPSVGGARYDAELPFAATRMGTLARAIKAAGITSIEGRVKGSTAPFAHDWFAPGWRWDFPARYAPLPSALSYDGNIHRGRHISDPELRAARALTQKLRAIGVPVAGDPGAGAPPDPLTAVAEVRSPTLAVLMRYMNRHSSNFFAEVLGKRLGLLARGAPGTIAKGAAAIDAWAGGHGVEMVAHDSSGLSYDNRISARSLSHLIAVAEDTLWGDLLREMLPSGGQGTLQDRFARVLVHAKTGTLDDVSALSGWVWVKRRATWAEFSILSRGLDKSVATAIEDRIVRIVANEG